MGKVGFRRPARPPTPRASLRRPVDYPVETFTDAERARLAPHVTNLDRPVFALVNLPETVKGALFARYSRYQGTLRRLFLDEFADSLPAGRPARGTRARASAPPQLYERIFLGYGDDSVAQLGGVHVACEWVSNVLTKVLQRPRLAAYLEQSTRYIAYDAPMPGGGYRYYRDPSLGPEYERAMDALFDTYAARCRGSTAWADAQFPPPDGEPSAAHARAIQAKALDLLRGLLPAASLSHMGIFATGQTYEQLILHLLAHPLPEARRYGRMILDAVKAVMPSFVTRVERPERGGEWVSYLEQREQAAERWVARLGLDREPATPTATRPSVRLLHVDGDEDALLAALLFEAAGVARRTTRIRLSALGADERGALLADLVGARAQPPPPPRPRLRGAALPLRDRLRLRRVPRPPAPPDAHRPVAAPAPAPRRGRPRARSRPPACGDAIAPRARDLGRRVGAPRRRRAASARRRTRSASASASATSST